MAPIASPFAARPLTVWIEDLQHATEADDRYRALLAVNALAVRRDALHWCRRALSDADSGVRALAAKQLREWKQRTSAVEAETESEAVWSDIETDLLSRLADADPDVRFEAARALGQVNPSLASPREVLLSLLDDEGTQPLMIAVVVSALGERRDVDCDTMIPRFQKLFEHTQSEVRENVAAVAAGSKAIAVGMISELVTALDDDEPLVRENAAIALGLAGDNSARVLTALVTAGTDDDEGVAVAAREAHARLSNI